MIDPPIARPLFTDMPTLGVPVVVGSVVPEPAGQVQDRMNAEWRSSSSSAAEAGVHRPPTAAELILRGSEVRGRRSFNVCPTRLMGAFWFIVAWAGWEIGFTDWWKPAGALETAWLTPSLCASGEARYSLCGLAAQRFAIPPDEPGISTQPGSNETLVVFHDGGSAVSNLSITLHDGAGALLLDCNVISLAPTTTATDDQVDGTAPLSGTDANPANPARRHLFRRGPHGHGSPGATHAVAPPVSRRPLAALPPYSYASGSIHTRAGIHTRAAVGAGTFVWLAAGRGHNGWVDADQSAIASQCDDSDGGSRQERRCNVRLPNALDRDVITSATFTVPDFGLALPLTLTVSRLEVERSLPEIAAAPPSVFLALYSLAGREFERRRRLQALTQRFTWAVIFVIVYTVLKQLHLGGMGDERCGGFAMHFTLAFVLTIALYRVAEHVLGI